MFKFCEKGAAWGAVVLRLGLGVIFIAHGTQKVSDLGATVEGMGASLHLPALVVVAVVFTELLGGIAILIGAFTRLAAVGIFCVMLGAVVVVHAPNGFFLQDHGYEYNIALMAMCIALIFSGAGPLSVDAKFAGFQQTKLAKHSYDERSG